jgi:hypothetical protein
MWYNTLDFNNVVVDCLVDLEGAAARLRHKGFGRGCRDLRAGLSIVDRGVGMASGMALHRRSSRQRSGT